MKSSNSKDVENKTDDEFIVEIEKNDLIIEQDYLSSLIEQEDRLIYYEVEDIYSNMDKRKYKNKLQLKKNPPVLVIKDDFENEAIFYLTENLTNELIDTLSEVKRAYHGFTGPADLNLPEKFMDRMIYYAKNKPLKLALPIIVVIIAVAFFFK